MSNAYLDWANFLNELANKINAFISKNLASVSYLIIYSRQHLGKEIFFHNFIANQKIDRTVLTQDQINTGTYLGSNTEIENQAAICAGNTMTSLSRICFYRLRLARTKDEIEKEDPEIVCLLSHLLDSFKIAFESRYGNWIQEFDTKETIQKATQQQISCDPAINDPTPEPVNLTDEGDRPPIGITLPPIASEIIINKRPDEMPDYKQVTSQRAIIEKLVRIYFPRKVSIDQEDIPGLKAVRNMLIDAQDLDRVGGIETSINRFIEARNNFYSITKKYFQIRHLSSINYLDLLNEFEKALSFFAIFIFREKCISIPLKEKMMHDIKARWRFFQSRMKA